MHLLITGKISLICYKGNTYPAPPFLCETRTQPSGCPITVTSPPDDPVGVQVCVRSCGHSFYEYIIYYNICFNKILFKIRTHKKARTFVRAFCIALLQRRQKCYPRHKYKQTKVRKRNIHARFTPCVFIFLMLERVYKIL